MILCVLTLHPSRAAASVCRQLAAMGFDVVSPGEAASCDDVELLVCFANGPCSAEESERWLAAVNNARKDVLVTTTGVPVLAPESTIWLADDGRTVDDATRRIAELTVVADAPEEVEIPKLLTVHGSNTLPAASTWQSLHGELRDRRQRVVPVRLEVLDELRNSQATSRDHYDVARFARWSHDRLDRSFVKLRMRLAGGDANSVAVTKEVTSLAEVLSDSRASNLVLVKGAPGAGKTLQLKRLETWCAIQSIRSGGEGAPIPFCAAMGEHATSNGMALDEWLEARWALRARVERMQEMAFHLGHGRMVLLLDGFNEIPFATADDRRVWMLRWRSFIHEVLMANPLATIVLACRTRDLAISIGSSDVPQTVAELMPLNEDEIFDVADRRNPYAARKLRAAIGSDPTFAHLYNSPFSLSDYLDVDEPEAEVPRTQSEIFLRRIRRALEREQERNSFRSFDAVWLPEPVVVDLIACTTLAELAAAVRAAPLFRALGALARDLTTDGVGRSPHSVALGSEDVVERLRKALGVEERSAQKALEVAIDLDLLMRNEGVIRFKHHTLQEFFAATAMIDDELADAVRIGEDEFKSRLGDVEQRLAELGPGDELATLPTTGYEQVVLRAAELRPAVVDRIGKANPWLAAEILWRHLGREPAAREVSAVRRSLMARLVATTDFRARRSTLLSLGLLQRAEGVDVELPPESIAVDAGDWTLGCSEELGDLLGSASPLRTVSLPAFAIGTAPITNAQYARFVAAGGYESSEYWCEEGWTWRSGCAPRKVALERWRSRRAAVRGRPELPLQLLERGRASIPQAAAIRRFAEMDDDELDAVVRALVGEAILAPAFWTHPRFCNPNQPVVGVSPFEADAYCRWLSAKTGRHFRLPTEDEWEVVAGLGMVELDLPARLDGRFPDAAPDGWPGGLWSLDYGNTTELHLNGTTPVGTFLRPDRQLADLFGNVFEWTADPFAPGDSSRRICKGGSWRHVAARALPTYRGRGDTTTRNDDDGFRVLEEVAT